MIISQYRLMIVPRSATGSVKWTRLDSASSMKKVTGLDEVENTECIYEACAIY